MSGGAIVVLVIVVLAVISIVGGPLLAASSGKTMASSFEQAYKAEFGVLPSMAAKQAISSGTAIINAHLAKGKLEQEHGKERLAQAINDYGAAVSWDEEKMTVGLFCLGAVCMNRDGSVAPGYGWATDVIESAMFAHCPNAVRNALGF